MSGDAYRERLGPIGVWAPAFRLGEPAEAGEAASELEQLGYGAAWVPGVGRAGPAPPPEPMRAASNELVLATGVVNIWFEDPAEVAAEFARLSGEHPGRVLVGLGISHEPLIQERYVRPLAEM